MTAKYSAYFVLVIVLLGVGLRFYHLGNQSIWQDEAYAVLCSDQTIAGILGWQIDDSSPPLYYVLLKCWVNLKNHGEWWVRAFSAISGSLFLIAFYLILKSLFNQQCALIGLFITALSSYHIYYSQEARMYSLLSLSSILIFYFFMRYTKKQGTISLVLYCVISILTLYIHNYGLFIVGTGFILALLKKAGDRDKKLLWAHFIVLCSYIPWLIVILSQLSSNNTAWIHRPEFNDLLRTLVYFAGRSWKLPMNYFNMAFIIAALAVLSGGLLYAIFIVLSGKMKDETEHSECENIKTAMIFLFLPLFSSFLLSYLKPVYVAGRYDIVFYPYFAVLSSYGISKITAKRTKYLLLIIVLSSNLLILRDYYFVFFKSNDKQLANYIFDKADPSTLLIFTDLSSTPFEYYSLSKSKKYDILRFPGGPRGWIEKDAFIKLRTFTEAKIALMFKEMDRHKKGKKEIWVMYEPYPPINKDFVEALASQYNLFERTRLMKGDLDNQVTEIYKYKIKRSDNNENLRPSY